MTATRQAWITLITRPSYLAGLLTLYRTLRAVSKYSLVVMATDALPPAARALIRDAGMTIVDVEHLAPSPEKHPGFDPAFLRLNDAWTKLRVFGLTQFDKLVLIDADMIFLRPMDEIFDLALPAADWIGAAPACVCNPLRLDHYPRDWVPANCSLSKQSRFMTLGDASIPAIDGPRTAHLLNSGLVVLHPSAATMDFLVEFLDSSPTVAEAKFADQDVIAEAFRGRWKPLPWWTNGLKTQRAVHPDVWADTEVRLIHYILDKPWAKRPDSSRPDEDRSTVNIDYETLPPGLSALVRKSPKQQSLIRYDEVHAWWWTVYDEVLETMQRDKPEEEWREMDQWVQR